MILVSGLYVVGSSLNGFGSNVSDMDLCLMITNKDVSSFNAKIWDLILIQFDASEILVLANHKLPSSVVFFGPPRSELSVNSIIVFELVTSLKV